MSSTKGPEKMAGWHGAWMAWVASYHGMVAWWHTGTQAHRHRQSLPHTYTPNLQHTPSVVRIFTVCPFLTYTQTLLLEGSDAQRQRDHHHQVSWLQRCDPQSPCESWKREPSGWGVGINATSAENIEPSPTLMQCRLAQGWVEAQLGRGVAFFFTVGNPCWVQKLFSRHRHGADNVNIGLSRAQLACFELLSCAPSRTRYRAPSPACT